MEKEIKILGLHFQIREVESVSNTENLLGIVDQDNLEIRIDSSIPDELKNEVLLHEILHAILVQIGLSDINQNESTVQNISSALYCTLGPYLTF